MPSAERPALSMLPADDLFPEGPREKLKAFVASLEAARRSRGRQDAAARLQLAQRPAEEEREETRHKVGPPGGCWAWHWHGTGRALAGQGWQAAFWVVGFEFLLAAIIL
jgi:hypothetical protein